ncbi:hypothetical protein [Motilibacter deserti]|uniref:CVNH domain-containing protein n=1 Tax=Motilibacter deserti TaxID=2714956 RepID=A0ABX0GS40_9ACTN|nr:hypothetical protein [Motilibacter deserti]NHC12906.1 hypothetical protein [Motilibacter deserti]
MRTTLGKKLGRTTAVASAAGVLASGALVALTAQPAAAGPLCSVGRICGNVTNSGSSYYSLTLTCNWNDQWGASLVVAPGQSGRSKGCADVDGYYVPSNRTVEERAYAPSGCSWNCSVIWIKRGSGWHKITDLQSPVLRVR